MKVLFEGIDPKDVDFAFVFDFAAELLTHLGIPLQNRSKSGDGTPYSLTEFISKDIDELLREAEEEEFGSCRKEILTALAFKRNGFYCPFTNISIDLTNSDGVVPVLSQIIPSSIHNKPDTLKCIAILAGTKLRRTVKWYRKYHEHRAKAYDDIKWAIQAKENDDGKVTYIFQKFVGEKNSPGPAPIKLRDGDEIPFGKGEGSNVEGPLPILCHLQSAVARVLRVSGAADLIAHLQDIADESDFSNEPDFANILTAKLLLNSGRFPPL